MQSKVKPSHCGRSLVPPSSAALLIARARRCRAAARSKYDAQSCDLSVIACPGMSFRRASRRGLHLVHYSEQLYRTGESEPPNGSSGRDSSVYLFAEFPYIVLLRKQLLTIKSTRNQGNRSPESLFAVLLYPCRYLYTQYVTQVQFTFSETNKGKSTLFLYVICCQFINVLWRCIISKHCTHVFIGHSKHEVAAFIVQFRDSWPIVVGHRMFPAQQQQTTRCQTEEVFHAVFALLTLSYVSLPF